MKSFHREGTVVAERSARLGCSYQLLCSLGNRIGMWYHARFHGVRIPLRYCRESSADHSKRHAIVHYIMARERVYGDVRKLHMINGMGLA